jgi:ATP-dependent Clp protease ATP-binding subunit ClpB
MLQILDDGRLTDGQGRTVDFKNTILIMTSNIGSPQILEFSGAVDGKDFEGMKRTILDQLKQHFRPEFLNRVDEVIVFHALTEAHLKKIVVIQLGLLRERLAEHKIDIQLSDSALDHIVRVGFDPAYGARPLKRALQKELENPLGRLLIEGGVREGQTVQVDYDSGLGELSFGMEDAPVNSRHPSGI